jgi:iron complex outermembrane receptor protein
LVCPIRTFSYYGSGSTLTSISALQRIGFSFKDIDFPGYYHSFYEKAIGEALPPQNVVSQELRINGTTANQKLRYTAGAFYFSQVGYEPSTNLAFELAPGAYSIFRNKSDNNGVAVFGELTYNITDKWSATGGLRYDNENRESTFNGFGDASFVGGVFTQIKQDTTVHDKTEYDFDEHFTPSGLTSEIPVTLTITVEDHNDNATTKMVKFKIKP